MTGASDTVEQDAPARRVILHCGVQKTGSTALHRYLERNRAALAGRLEVLTPARKSLTQRLGRAVMLYSLEPGEARRSDLLALARQMRAHLAEGQGNALISHENFPGAMIGKRGVTTLYPHLEEILAVLEEGLAPFRPEVVIYTRGMPAWKKSVFNQAVKSDHYPRSEADFLAETEACGTWDALEARAVAALGRARVTLFRLEDERDPARPGTQLLRHAGLSDDEIAELTPGPRRANQSLNPGALEFMRQINGLSLDPPIRRKLADLVVANQTLFVTDIVQGARA